MGQLGPTCGQFCTNLNHLGVQLGHRIPEKSLFFIWFFNVFDLPAFMHSWGQLVTNKSSFGGMLALLWTVFGPTSSILGLTWAQIEPSWRLLGLSWRYLEANFGNPGPILEPTFAILKLSWAPVRHFRVNNGPSSSQLRTTLARLVQLRPFWVHFGGFLKHFGFSSQLELPNQSFHARC